MAAFFKRTLSFLGLAEEDNRDDIDEDYSYSSGRDRLESVKDRYFADDEESGGNKFKSFFHRDENKKTAPAGRKPTPPTHRLMSVDIARDAKSARMSIEEPHEFE